MKSTTLATIPLIALLSFSLFKSAHADNIYQFGVGGLISDTTSDSGTDSRIYGASAYAYLHPINSGAYPYAESDFVSRESFVSGLFGQINLEMLSSEITGKMMLVSAGYGDNNFPLFFDFTYGKSDTSGEVNNNDLAYEADIKSLSIGYYIDELSAFQFGYTREDNEFTVNNNKTKGHANEFELQFKKLIPTSNSTFLNLTAKLSHSKDDEEEENQEGGFQIKYYLNKSFGFGGGILVHISDDETDEGKTLKLQTSKFITPTTRIDLVFNKFMANDGESDHQNIELRAGFRF